MLASVARAAQAAVLVVAAALRLWRLDQNGFDNEYYAAAVRSMMARTGAVARVGSSTL